MTRRLGLILRMLLIVLNAQALVLYDVRAETLAGWVERAWVDQGSLVLDAKLDTGAENSSVHAPNPQWFERSGEDWVRFRLADRYGESVDIERPVVRTVRIKRHAGPGQKRPVVILGVCVGTVHKEVEVNLVDRGSFQYRLLLGRSFLAGDLVVDSSKRHNLSLACPVRNIQQ